MHFTTPAGKVCEGVGRSVDTVLRCCVRRVRPTGANRSAAAFILVVACRLPSVRYSQLRAFHSQLQAARCIVQVDEGPSHDLGAQAVSEWGTIRAISEHVSPSLAPRGSTQPGASRLLQGPAPGYRDRIKIWPRLEQDRFEIGSSLAQDWGQMWLSLHTRIENCSRLPPPLPPETVSRNSPAPSRNFDRYWLVAMSALSTQYRNRGGMAADTLERDWPVHPGPSTKYRLLPRSPAGVAHTPGSKGGCPTSREG